MNNPISILHDFVAIPSVSTDSTKKKYMKEAISFMEKLLTPFGFKMEIIETADHPCLVAYKDIGAKHTIGFYSHYDVQPAEPLDLWESPAFTLTQKDGLLVGRGTADDKAHIIQTIAAIEKAIKENSLNSNIVLLYEGEEEIGSTHFEECMEKLIQRIKKTDVFYVLDSSLSNNGHPMIMYGLRGMLYYGLKITAAKHDLHSGTMGNLVPNPANIMSEFLASLKDKKNHVTIPHFYKDVPAPTIAELENLKKAKGPAGADLTETGVKEYYLPDEMPYYAASKCWPRFDINGIYSGFIEDGIKTIIPAYATANFSFRLVPNQNPQEIDILFRKYTKTYFQTVPVTYELTLRDKCMPFVTTYDNEWVRKTDALFEKHFKKETIYNRSGGTISAAEVLSRLTGKPIITTGFALSTSNLHGPNENISEYIFLKGIDVLSDIISQ